MVPAESYISWHLLGRCEEFNLDRNYVFGILFKNQAAIKTLSSSISASKCLDQFNNLNREHIVTLILGAGACWLRRNEMKKAAALPSKEQNYWDLKRQYLDQEVLKRKICINIAGKNLSGQTIPETPGKLFFSVKWGRFRYLGSFRGGYIWLWVIS